MLHTVRPLLPTELKEMSSIGHVKDDSSPGTQILCIVFIVVYSALWVYSAVQLQRRFYSGVVFRLIHSLILVFLVRTLQAVRIFFWLDVVFNYTRLVYFILQSFPNFILYNIGQVFCYFWCAPCRLKIRFDLTKASDFRCRVLKFSFVAFNLGIDVIYFVAMVLHYSASSFYLNIAM
jgi:hypothetical protein